LLQRGLIGANAPDDAAHSPPHRTATRQIDFIRGYIFHEAHFNQYAILNKTIIASRIQPCASCSTVFPQLSSPARLPNTLPLNQPGGKCGKNCSLAIAP